MDSLMSRREAAAHRVSRARILAFLAASADVDPRDVLAKFGVPPRPALLFFAPPLLALFRRKARDLRYLSICQNS